MILDISFHYTINIIPILFYIHSLLLYSILLSYIYSLIHNILAGRFTIQSLRISANGEFAGYIFPGCAQEFGLEFRTETEKSLMASWWEGYSFCDDRYLRRPSA
jgi:hypothetical protein